MRGGKKPGSTSASCTLAGHCISSTSLTRYNFSLTVGSLHGHQSRVLSPRWPPVSGAVLLGPDAIRHHILQPGPDDTGSDCVARAVG